MICTHVGANFNKADCVNVQTAEIVAAKLAIKIYFSACENNVGYNRLVKKSAQTNEMIIKIAPPIAEMVLIYQNRFLLIKNPCCA